ncbi:MAG: hypothetical protein FJ100_01360 [Deltaproteobacteria bacterium]|nr:hypothetical protein [Deltaproteobacteria bacterium]
MDRKVGFVLLGVLALVTAYFLVSGLSSGPAAPAASKGEAGGKEDDHATSGAAAQAPVIKREQAIGDQPAPDAANLALPGQLPALKGVQGAAGATGPVAGPVTPHGQLELDGDVKEEDAEAAIKAMWPAIKDCYVELRQRAPQARGRMLMNFKVRPAEANQAATGEMFLKETQFTDPKYLTCVRAAIDNARFPVAKNLNGSVTVPLFLAPQDAGEPAAQ